MFDKNIVSEVVNISPDESITINGLLFCQINSNLIKIQYMNLKDQMRLRKLFALLTKQGIISL